MANMNVGAPNFVSTYHKMTLEEYQKMSFVPTKANLEKRRLEQESAALQTGKRDDNAGRRMTDNDAGERKSMTGSEVGEDTFSTSSTVSPSEQTDSRSNSQPKIRRLSGNFNAPTHVEVERHNDVKGSRSIRGTIKSWMKKSPPPTVA